MGFYKKSGGGVIIDGVAVNEPLKLITDSIINEQMGTMPFYFSNGAVVMLDNEIHMLGGQSAPSKHYKYNGTEWAEVSTLPYSFYKGTAVVYQGKIHILSGGTTTHHYSWDGGTWVKESTIPSNVAGDFCKACVFNDEIHMFYGSGGSSANNHYKWNGIEWAKDVSCPIYCTNSAVCIFNGELHLTYDTAHYKFDGAVWQNVSTTPRGFNKHCMMEVDGKLHVFGGNNVYNCNYHYIWDGTAWTQCANLLPSYFMNGGIAYLNGYFHLIGGEKSSSYHHVLDVPKYKKVV